MEQFDSNQVSQRLFALILYAPYQNEAPASGINRLSDYLKLTGTKYIFLDETSPFTKAFTDKSLDGKYIDLGQIKLTDSIYHAFEVSWHPRDAVLINPADSQSLDHFPFTLTFENNNDFELLDQYVNSYVSTIYSPQNRILKTAYPNQETVAVKIPPNPFSNIVYLDESYSTGWAGYFNSKKAAVYPSGPNFMKIILPTDSLQNGGMLILKHSWPQNMMYLVFMIALTPFLLLFFNVTRALIGVYTQRKIK
jgi:hypothetical protein